MRKYLKLLPFLGLGGLLMVLGGWRLIDPTSFFSFHGVGLGADAGSLSEARATGAVVVGFASVIVLGAFREPLRPASLLIAVVLFYSFALGRVFGVVADGPPPAKVVQGIISEVVLGSIALVVYVRARVARRGR